MSVNRPLHVRRTSTAGHCEVYSTCDSDEHNAAAATVVSYHACSCKRVALRRVSEAVASLTRAEVEAAARAPESTVAVLCYKQRNQAECVLQQCVGPRGHAVSYISQSTTRGAEADPQTGGRGGWGRGGTQSATSASQPRGCSGGSSDRREGRVGPRGTQSATSASQPRGVQRRILRPEGGEGGAAGARSQLHQPVNHEGAAADPQTGGEGTIEERRRGWNGWGLWAMLSWFCCRFGEFEQNLGVRQGR